MRSKPTGQGGLSPNRAPLIVSRAINAGVQGLEPRLTEPESVVLPITPYPIGVSLFPAALRRSDGDPRMNLTGLVARSPNRSRLHAEVRTAGLEPADLDAVPLSRSQPVLPRQPQVNHRGGAGDPESRQNSTHRARGVGATFIGRRAATADAPAKTRARESPWTRTEAARPGDR